MKNNNVAEIMASIAARAVNESNCTLQLYGLADNTFAIEIHTALVTVFLFDGVSLVEYIYMYICIFCTLGHHG